jgi:hypothetical protein
LIKRRLGLKPTYEDGGFDLQHVNKWPKNRYLRIAYSTKHESGGFLGAVSEIADNVRRLAAFSVDFGRDIEKS